MKITRTRLEYYVIPCFIAAVFLTSMLQFQFPFVRYHLEYYYEAARWNLQSSCEYGKGYDKQLLQAEDHHPIAEWGGLISKQLATDSDQWVIYKPTVGLGLCNRIISSLSCLLLAMATNRKLWIEWDQHDMEQISANELAGMSSFDDLFVSDFQNSRLRPPVHIIENATDVRPCLLERLLFSSDLNKDFDAKSIMIDGGDWWGGLLFRNKAYASTVFKGLKPMQGFPVLFRSMFALHPPAVTPKRCTWMIQFRTIWTPPRYTAPIKSFLECAHAKGMTPDDYSTTWIVADDPRALLRGVDRNTFRVLNAMNLPQENKTCRGPCGDRHAMETMYSLSRCSNAVLTFGSSFGSCIANLAAAPRQFRVSHYGDCLDAVTEDPIDINTHSRRGNIATYLAQMQDRGG